MAHCTPELLALAALREPLPDDDAAHLDGCAECRADVAGLQRGVDLLSVPEFAMSAPPVPPPPSVWTSIAAATGVTSAPRAERAVTAGVRPPADSPVAPAPSNVVPFRARRPRPWTLAVAAAIVGVAVGAGAVAALQRGEDGAALAAAALDPLENADASGSARVIQRADGTRVLEVDLRAPELDGAYYEVWLLEPDVSGLVPLGATQAGSTAFEIPTGLDLDKFPVVDISVEPLDGDPAHSGDSVVRGVLES